MDSTPCFGWSYLSQYLHYFRIWSIIQWILAYICKLLYLLQFSPPLSSSVKALNATIIWSYTMFFFFFFLWLEARFLRPWPIVWWNKECWKMLLNKINKKLEDGVVWSIVQKAYNIKSSSIVVYLMHEVWLIVYGTCIQCN